MSRSRPRSRRRPRRLALTCAALLAGILAFWVGLGGHHVTRAVGLTGAPELVAQTDDSVPVQDVTFFGASPEESAGEVWGVGRKAGNSVLVRYSQSSGWSRGPGFLNAAGEALSGFLLDTPEEFRHEHPSPLAAQMTPDGAGAMLGTVGSGTGARQVLLVRNPGGAFQEATVPSGGEGLQEGETLFGGNRAPMVAALEEAGGSAGALVVPVNAGGVDSVVLHRDGSGNWTREPIEVPAKSSGHLEALAIGASSPGNAWLLARLSSEYKEGSVTLFRRHLGGGTPSWQPVTVKSGSEPGEPIEVEGETFAIPSPDQAQLLTVTSSGLWLDGQLHGAKASATVFFKPEGEAAAGTVAGTWCKIPAGSSATVAACERHEHETVVPTLPETLPTDFSRSYAWPGAGGFGERVVSGLRDGRLLRLSGSEFDVVNSLGGKTGAEFGSAFTGSQDGWLGAEQLPVHVTTHEDAKSSRLSPWPVPFRYALTALAPAPGAAVGAEGSEVLAVGDRGEVARYHPGQGWFPETLPAPNGERATPRLRAVAWPTPNRAYAVGDTQNGAGQMWLWRGETGLWEKDPAVPVNFRSNLLGIAFDPDESSRGYAVGQGGTLLSYGKTWTQEPEEDIPPAARGASFTSIAFAGSEAIVAWRKLLHLGQDAYTGGIIVNNGSGWHEDAGAAEVLGTARVPWAVAALPDGGAAFTAGSPTEGGTIYERNGPGAPWQAFPYPGGFAPGALALFREGGALRAIGTGGEPDTYVAEEESEPPPGFPSILLQPYPLVSDSEAGVLRQTADGWEDEEHELNDAKEPPGGYEYWDTPYVPDPVSAVLVNESGTQGWAVGGNVDNRHALMDTSDIYRYPSEGKAPPGVGEDPEASSAANTTVAIGGGAGCAAPCAARADTGIGPSVWLHDAIDEAAGIGGVQAFFYTGPGVTTGLTAGPPEIPVPWQTEEDYYAARMAGTRLPVYPVASPTDREGTGSGSESAFEGAFPGVGEGRECAGTASCESAYYAASLASGKGRVKVIMLDESMVQSGQREVTEAQLTRLKERLVEAASEGAAAIVVGNADLPREYSEGRPAARKVVEVLEHTVIEPKPKEEVPAPASAYFFDAPEQNVKETLTGGEGAVPAYGSGTLGYVNVIAEENGGFIGQSGFLLAEVSPSREASGRYPVKVRLVPNVAELAIEAQQGTLLRRSHAASFTGLARRPRSGNRAHNQAVELETAPYVAIPDNCLGAGCEHGIEPFYEFSSSATEYGNFVKRNLHSAQPNAVLENSKNEPIIQEGGHDGLFCAFNATPPGHPVYVSLKVGNLSYSLPVTIQAGSVRQPCGTTKLNKKPATATASVVPASAPVGGGSTPSGATPVVPVPPVPAPAAPSPAPHPPLLQPFLVQPAPAVFLPPFVPVPVPTPARPTPPSGTSAVTSPVEAPQKEEEEEAAPESASAEAVAYRQTEHEPSPVYLIGVVLLAAFAGASLRGRPGRGTKTRVAPATLTTSRAQRRMDREVRDRRR